MNMPVLALRAGIPNLKHFLCTITFELTHTRTHTHTHTHINNTKRNFGAGMVSLHSPDGFSHLLMHTSSLLGQGRCRGAGVMSLDVDACIKYVEKKVKAALRVEMLLEEAVSACV